MKGVRRDVSCLPCLFLENLVCQRSSKGVVSASNQAKYRHDCLDGSQLTTSTRSWYGRIMNEAGFE
jgi:hypothetical protein